MLSSIKKIEQIEPFKLTLRFGDGSVRMVDLEEYFRSKSTRPESKFRILLDFENFKKVKLHPEWETVYWPNDIDLCPDRLYQMSEEIAYSQK